MYLLAYALLLYTAIPIALSGHIYSWDLSVSYGYSGQPVCFTLPFMLETGLGASEYVRVDMPFALGSNPQAFLVNQ
jgi:hypothetical protein